MHYLDPVTIIKAVGLIGIFTIVFAESGLFFGFFFPGDSLLFTAGLFAHAGILPFYPLLIGCIIAAIAGDSVGYFTGFKMGPKIFNKEDSSFFKKKYLVDAQAFYEKHGKKTIVLARFIPFIRTFAPIVAGVGNMRYRTFILYNIVSGIVWPVLMLSLGYYIGSVFPKAQDYLFLITAIMIVVSIIPIIIQIKKKRA
jgi:membrane-associated protein